MLSTTNVRALSAADLPALRELLDRDPLVNLFVRHRVDLTGLQERLMGGRIWGYYDGDELVSACHAGANIVPVQATPEAIQAFSDQVLSDGLRPASLVGLRSAVMPMWERVESTWGPARSLRPFQPFLELDEDPTVAPDPRVHRVLLDEFDVLYPACVAMFTEEVGVDPEIGGASGYRARVAQLISQSWAFAIIEDGEVQDRGRRRDVVRVPAAGGVGAARPAWPGHRHSRAGRGRGARPGDGRTRRHVVVNDHNRSARRTYERVGFRETAMFSSILL